MLSWTCTQVAAWVQSMMFGFTGSILSDWLHLGWHCLNIVLYDNEHAKIEMGSDEKYDSRKKQLLQSIQILTMSILLLMGLS